MREMLATAYYRQNKWSLATKVFLGLLEAHKDKFPKSVDLMQKVAETYYRNGDLDLVPSQPTLMLIFNSTPKGLYTHVEVSLVMIHEATLLLLAMRQSRNFPRRTYPLRFPSLINCHRVQTSRNAAYVTLESLSLRSPVQRPTMISG